MVDNRFVTFLSLAKTKSYTKTANDLFISQPGVTHHIKSLENDFGCKLFEIINKKLKLTSAGELMLNFAQQQVNSYSQFEDLLKNNDISNRVMKMGTSEIICEYYLTDILREWIKNYPDDKIDIYTDDDTIELFNAIETSNVDFIISDNLFDKEKYEYRLLKSTEIILVCGPNSPLRMKKKVALKNILDLRWFVADVYDSTTRLVTHELSAHNLSFDSVKTISRIQNINTTKHLVECNLGIAFLPRCSVNSELADGSLIEVKLTDVSLVKEINFVYSKTHLNKQRLIDICNEMEQLKRKAIYDKYEIIE